MNDGLFHRTVSSSKQQRDVVLFLVLFLKERDEVAGGVWSSLAIPPDSPATSIDPRGAHPLDTSILGGSRESASINCRLTSLHFPSMVARLWVTRKGERALMKRSSYGEQDYAFGQAMLTLRTTIGLTQAGLAESPGVSRRAVGKWEVGSSYPKAEHVKCFMAVAVKHQAFPAGREAEEIRAFWQAARQKLLLDEPWLAALLSQQLPRLTLLAPLPVEQSSGIDHVLAPPAAGGPRVDWGDALAVPTFYGRERELALLAQWVVEEGCRVVSVLGMGGIGKSALVVSAMHQLAAHFQVVLFRSLRDAPSCEALLDDCLQVLAQQPLDLSPASLESRISRLLEDLRSSRGQRVMYDMQPYATAHVTSFSAQEPAMVYVIEKKKRRSVLVGIPQLQLRGCVGKFSSSGSSHNWTHNGRAPFLVAALGGSAAA